MRTTSETVNGSINLPKSLWGRLRERKIQEGVSISFQIKKALERVMGDG